MGAPLASGISICGVSAAIPNCAAILARPIVPIMVSSLVVIFAVVEPLVLPFAAGRFLYHEPMVAGACMGLAAKTDGGGRRGQRWPIRFSGPAQAADGVQYEKDWIMGAATTVKVFIDVFIGIGPASWPRSGVRGSTGKPGGKLPLAEIWQRFPKFVFGYLFTFLAVVLLAARLPGSMDKLKAAMGEANGFRTTFFCMTFFSSVPYQTSASSGTRASANWLPFTSFASSALPSGWGWRSPGFSFMA